MKKYIIIVSIILIVLIISLVLFLNNNNNEQLEFEEPGEYIDELNDSLSIIENNLKSSNIKYDIEKSKNSEIYSMLVTIHSDDIEYQSYNIDLKSKKILNLEEVASMFDLTLKDIYSKINMRLKTYYDEEVNEGFVDSNECDFECYKPLYRNIENVETSFALYVKNEKLYIYLNFSLDTFMEDKSYFDNLDYNPFVIEI